MVAKFYFRTCGCRQCCALKVNFLIVFFSKNDKYFKGGKYIEIKDFVINEKVQKYKVSIEYISTNLIIANPLTNRLPIKTFNENVERMGIVGHH